MDGWSNMPPPPGPETLPDEIEKVKGIVGKHFPIYDVKIHFNTISLYCNIDPEMLESQFDILRKEMKNENYIPILKYEKGEYIVHVVKQPRMKFRSINLNLVLLIATVITTILAGSLLWLLIMNTGADNLDLGQMFEPGNIVNGAFYFALPLMLILGVHEMAHYYAAKRHGVAASLPFFIPVPPIFVPPLGTMGAFISIREPIPNRKALLDIGIAGPIAGFLVAIPVTIVGLLLSSPLEVATQPGFIEGGTILIGDSALFISLKEFLPLPESVLLHPTAFAGWVGLFVTALNLLPAGQLDGGHIARALMGDKSRYASYAAFGLMLVLGLQFTGWLVFAMIIMFLGLRHPPPLNDVTKLDGKRKMLGIATAVILVLSFVPIPFQYVEPAYAVDFMVLLDDGNLSDSPSFVMDSSTANWTYLTMELYLNSSANVEARVELTAKSSNESLTTTGFGQANSTNLSAARTVIFEPFQMKNITLDINILPGANGSATITVRADYYYNGEVLDYEKFGLNDEIRIYLDIELEL